IPVEQCSDESVDQWGAEFLHEIQGQGWFSGSNAVEISDVGVQTDVFEGSEHGDTQHAISEGQQAVDGISGWFPRPTGSSTRYEGRDGLEIAAGDTPFDAEDHVQGGALLEWGERVDVLLGQVSEGGSAGSAGVSGGAQEHLSIVVDFPGDQCFREVQAPFGLVVGADLFDSQQGVAGLGADSAVQE